MRIWVTLAATTALLACPTPAASEADHGDRVGELRRLVEVALPVVSKDGRQVELSLQGWMQALRIPGMSVAVIEDHRVAWARGYGRTAAGPGGSPVTASTLFQAGSVSKPVAAIAVLQQVEKGRLDLDADIHTYLRSWKVPDRGLPDAGVVSVRHLLGHTAGITPGGFAGYERNAALPTILQVLNGSPPASNGAARRTSASGTAVNYSGLGYTVLQLALMERLGRPFEEIVRACVFEPVGMRDSTFQPHLPDALASRAANGHRLTGEGIPGGWFVHPESAAAGLWTTPSDLALLWIEVAQSKAGRSRRVLSGEMARLMLAPHRDEMGLGFVVRPGEAHGRFAHSGGNQGFRSHVEMFAGTGQGVVVMTNSDAGHLLTALLVRRIAQVHGWPPEHQRPVSPELANAIFAQLDLAKADRIGIDVPTHVLNRYAGRYELAPGLTFEVTVSADQLHVRLGDQPRFPVYAESDVKFFFKVVDAQITFVLNEEGRATRLVLHQGGRDQAAMRIE